MASGYSSLLRLELMGTGDQPDLWGVTLNSQFQLLENAVAGRAAVTHSNAVDYTLTTVNGAADEARKMIVSVSGTLTAARNVVCPTLSKIYAYRNSTVGGHATTFKTTAGTGVSVPNAKSMLLVCDGTNVVDAISHHSSLTLGTPLAIPDGGTGSNNPTDARTALGMTAANLGLGTMATQAASAVAITGGTISGVAISAASQAEMEAGSSTTVTGTPGRQHFHRSAAKAYASWDDAGNLSSNVYGISSITDTGVGQWTVNYATPFSHVDHTVLVSCGDNGGRVAAISFRNFSSVQVVVRDLTANVADSGYQAVAAYGDFA